MESQIPYIDCTGSKDCTFAGCLGRTLLWENRSVISTERAIPRIVGSALWRSARHIRTLDLKHLEWVGRNQKKNRRLELLPFTFFKGMRENSSH